MLLLNKKEVSFDKEIENYKNILLNMDIIDIENLYNSLFGELKNFDKIMMITSILNYIDFMSSELLKFYLKTNKKYTEKNQTNELAIKFYKNNLSTLEEKFLNQYPSFDFNVQIFINNLKKYLNPVLSKNYQEQISLPKEQISSPKILKPINLDEENDIELILDEIQDEKTCNPLENLYCPDNYYCNINTTPGKCYKNNNENLQEVIQNGHKIIGDFNKINDFGKSLFKKGENVDFEYKEEIIYEEPLREGDEVLEDIYQREEEEYDPENPYFPIYEKEFDTINIDNVENLLNQINETPDENLNNIDIVENQIMKCLGLIT
jgi:hypothetical protein